MQLDAVLFDLFNTLVLLESDDTFYLPSLEKLHSLLTKKHIDVSFGEFVRVYFEVRDKLYEKTNETLEDPHFNIRVAETLKTLGYRYTASHPMVREATEAFSKEFMNYMHPDDDAVDVLRKLHRKYKLGLVSNLSIPELVPTVLRKFQLSDFFDAIVVSGAMNKRKPSPEIFNKALRTLRVEPHRALFVGDTPGIDIKGAKSVGLKAVLIERGPSSGNSIALAYEVPSQDRNTPPDITIKSLRELLNIVRDC